MKRSQIERKGGLQRRTALKPKRATPRRRSTPQWTKTEWEQGNLILMARAGYACERCGHDDMGIERHHRKRRRDGGESFQNLVALCPPCHALVHARPALARKFGFIVSVSRDPVTIPILWRLREWILLTEDGGKVPAFDVEDAHA